MGFVRVSPKAGAPILTVSTPGTTATYGTVPHVTPMVAPSVTPGQRTADGWVTVRPCIRCEPLVRAPTPLVTEVAQVVAKASRRACAPRARWS